MGLIATWWGGGGVFFLFRFCLHSFRLLTPSSRVELGVLRSYLGPIFPRYEMDQESLDTTSQNWNRRLSAERQRVLYEMLPYYEPNTLVLSL